MITLLLAAAALAADPGKCETVSMADVLAVPAPAVIVLGERHGTEPDLWRATRVVKALSSRGHVTVALEAVQQKYQPTLDAYAAGSVDPDALEGQLDWSHSWGFPWAPYEKLVTAARWGAKVVAAGVDLGPAPAGADFPVPAGYGAMLQDAMAGHAVDPAQEGDFVKAMAWRDHEIARLGVQAWDGQGWLVIVTGRGHVEGGKGVNWQAAQMTEKKVESFVLANGGDAPCYEGDKVWKLDPIFG